MHTKWINTLITATDIYLHKHTLTGKMSFLNWILLNKLIKHMEDMSKIGFWQFIEDIS